MTDVTGLRALRSLRAHGSLEAAARAHAVEPRVLRQHVARLERDLGQPLVRSRPHLTVLDDAGAVVDRADDVLRCYEQFADVAAQLRSGEIGRLTFVVVGTDSCQVLSPALQALHATAPGLELDVRHVEARHADQLLDGVRTVVVIAPERWQVAGPPLAEDVRCFYAEETVAVLAADDPLAGRPDLSTDDLAHRRVLELGRHGGDADVAPQVAAGAVVLAARSQAVGRACVGVRTVTSDDLPRRRFTLRWLPAQEAQTRRARATVAETADRLPSHGGLPIAARRTACVPHGGAPR